MHSTRFAHGYTKLPYDAGLVFISMLVACIATCENTHTLLYVYMLLQEAAGCDIVFIAGGACFSEVRSVYEVRKELNAEVILGKRIMNFRTNRKQTEYIDVSATESTLLYLYCVGFLRSRF
jgi:hypothetical protein